MIKKFAVVFVIVCLMFSACQSLTKPPKACNEYNYPIRKLEVDIEPTLPGE